MSESAARAAFDTLKGDFREGRFPMIAGRMCGEAVEFGAGLLGLYAKAGRAELEAADVMVRFWALRHRGLPQPGDLTGADGGAAFVMAFMAFPYLDLLMESWELGEAVEAGPDRVVLRCLFDGIDQGSVVTASKGPSGWRFDLMDLYRAKLAMFETFITAEYGDFERFFDAYVAEHDLPFNSEQAWSPLET